MIGKECPLDSGNSVDLIKMPFITPDQSQSWIATDMSMNGNHQ